MKAERVSSRHAGTYGSDKKAFHPFATDQGGGRPTMKAQNTPAHLVIRRIVEEVFYQLFRLLAKGAPGVLKNGNKAAKGSNSFVSRKMKARDKVSFLRIQQRLEQQQQLCKRLQQY